MPAEQGEGAGAELPLNPFPSTAPESSLIPENAQRPGDDPIFSLHAEAQRRAAAGEDILNLTVGALTEDDGSLAVMPSVREALGRVPFERAAAYAPIAGDAPFLKAVVADLYGTGELARRSVAVATAGGTGALHHAIVNFLEPGQALLTTSYFWGPYAILADHSRRRIETFEMFDDSGGFHLAAFEQALDRQLEAQGRALVVLNSPCHNPTGYALDEDEWRAVARILRARAGAAPIALLIDNAYAKFGPPDSQDWYHWIEDLADHIPLLVAWTVSKSFAQYGARVGALVVSHSDEAERKRIFNALSYSCRGTWSNCNHLGLLAITELLTDDELRRRSEEDRARLKALLAERVAAFNAQAEPLGLRYPRYEGGFFVAVFTPDGARTAARMRELGVFVVPLRGAVRVALCCTPVAAVPRLVEALVEGVRAAQ